MKIPAGISGPIVAAIAGGVALAGEVAISHPLHQAIVIAAGLVTGLLGYFTLPVGAGPAPQAGPPYAIPSPLPVSSAPAPPASSRAAVDAAASAAATKLEQGLP